MANHHRGEVEFQALGKTWKMKLGTNAMCEIETAAGKGINELAAEMSDPAKLRLGLMRAVFRAGVATFHDGITDQEAGDIIDDIGVEKAADMIGAAFVFAMPEASEDANPQKATPAAK